MNNQTVKIKICGLSRPVDCAAVNASGADYAGFIFAPSRRQVSIDLAQSLVRHLDASVIPVGVFVDESDDFILQAVRQAGLAIVQLHGSPDPGKILRLRKALPKTIGIWQRIAVSLDLAAAEAFKQATADMRLLVQAAALPDAWLVDSCRKDQVGGTGETFDWAAFDQLDRSIPLVLAGGLNPDNVRQAIQMIQPDIVDASSGVESQGYKDQNKIEQFCSQVRQQHIKTN